MNGCILFASHIPNPNKLYVGKESLDKFVESFSDYDIYIGINNSCPEWEELINEYKSKLNIYYEVTPTELLETSGGAAYQTALRLLKSGGKKYDIYWFGHTKGATSNCDDFREEVFDRFWNKKSIIEDEMINNGFSLYSPYVALTTHNYLNTTLPIFIEGPENDNMTSFYSFWVHDGETMNNFLDKCIPEFYNTNLITFERLEGCPIRNSFVDRYFFERDFPMIYQKLCEEPKMLYNHISSTNPSEIEYIRSKSTKKLEL